MKITNSTLAHLLMIDENCSTLIIEQNNYPLLPSISFAADRTYEKLGSDFFRVAIFRVTKTPVPLQTRLSNRKGNARPITPVMSASLMKQFITDYATEFQQ